MWLHRLDCHHRLKESTLTPPTSQVCSQWRPPPGRPPPWSPQQRPCERLQRHRLQSVGDQLLQHSSSCRSTHLFSKEQAFPGKLKRAIVREQVDLPIVSVMEWTLSLQRENPMQWFNTKCVILLICYRGQTEELGILGSGWWNIRYTEIIF